MKPHEHDLAFLLLLYASSILQLLLVCFAVTFRFRLSDLELCFYSIALLLGIVRLSAILDSP